MDTKQIQAELQQPQHTPGPWIIRIISTQGNINYYISDKADLKHVADITDVVPHSETKANAHLIVLAPEMYELLKECLKILNDFPLAIKFQFLIDRIEDILTE